MAESKAKEYRDKLSKLREQYKAEITAEKKEREERKVAFEKNKAEIVKFSDATIKGLEQKFKDKRHALKVANTVVLYFRNECKDAE